MALEHILKDMEEQAAENCRQIVKEAQERAEFILQEARDEAELIKAEAVKKATVNIDGEKARIVSGPKLQVKRELVKAKEEIIAHIFDSVSKELAGMSSSNGYAKVMGDLLDEALQGTNGTVSVHVRKQDEPLARDLLAGRKGQCEVSGTLDGLGGVRVVSTDGRLAVDNTIESRLEKARRLLRPDVTKTLFGSR